MTKHSTEDKHFENVVYQHDLNESYRPYLIHYTTCDVLSEQILTLMPSQRNIVLSMNEYDLNEINPTHSFAAPDSPTHVIIFCIRFVTDNFFQPIGGLLIYKYKNQSFLLAECVKAYINDLWKLGLYVIATVSPPFETFKAILSHLVEVENFDSYADVISYSVTPFKEIIHIYDIQFLLVKLQNFFKEGDIVFEEGIASNKRLYRASWNDISVVLFQSANSKMASDLLMDNKDLSHRVHIFTEQIYEQFLVAEAEGILSSNAPACAVLLNSMRMFLTFNERDCVYLDKINETKSWDCLVDIFKTMTFQKSMSRTCKKQKCHTVHVLKNSSVRRKIDFVVGVSDVDSLSEEFEDKVLIEENIESIGNILNTCDNTEYCKSCNPIENKKICDVKNIILEPRVKCSCRQIQFTETFQHDSCDATISSDPNYLKTVKNCSELGKKTRNNIKILKKSNSVVSGFPERDKKHSEDLKKNKILLENNITCENTDTNLGSVNIITNKETQKNCEKDGNNNRDENNHECSWNNSNMREDVHDTSYCSDPSIFRSESYEETEKYITSNCDKVPNILEFLDGIENKSPNTSKVSDFEEDCVSCEMLCTIIGMRKLLELLVKRRVRYVKPNAFIVEHIDFLVTIIKKEINHIDSVHYYGHHYQLLNPELAFATLQNNSGLLLITKD